MSYLITIIISIASLLVAQYFIKKKPVVNKSLEEKYEKAMQEIQTLKDSIQDVANEETPSTIDSLIDSLNE